MTLKHLPLSFLALCAFTAPAMAGTYQFSFGSIFGMASGEFTTAGDASGAMSEITALTGTLDGNSITLLAPGTYPASGVFLNDNLFTEVFPHFTFGGVSFSAGGQNYNLYKGVSGNPAFCGQSPACSPGSITNFTVSAVDNGVPEPESWALMLGGFGLLGAAARQRTRAKFALA